MNFMSGIVSSGYWVQFTCLCSAPYSKEHGLSGENFLWVERDLPKADASPVLQQTPRRWERLVTAHKLVITGRQGPSLVGERDQASWNSDLAKYVLMWAEYCVTSPDPIRGLGEGENGGPISTLVPFDDRFGGSASATGYLGKLYNPLIQSVQIWVLAYKSAAMAVPDA